MHYITTLIRRRALLIATVAFVFGCILVAWMLARVLSDPGPAQAATVMVETSFDPGIAEEAPTEQAQAAPAALIVYITGAVVAPDVYRLPIGARLKDLVIAAGGFLADADPLAINLAAPLSDAEHIHIPRQGEQSAVEPALAEATAASQPAAAGSPIDLNSASAADLDALPGIGPALAERIVAYRQANGPFAAVEDLANVKGIGSALIEKIIPLVTIGS